MSRKEFLNRASAELGKAVPYFALRYAIETHRVPAPTQRIGSSFIYTEQQLSAFVQYMRQRLAAKVA